MSKDQTEHAMLEAMEDVIGEFELGEDADDTESVDLAWDIDDARDLIEALDRRGYKIVRK